MSEENAFHIIDSDGKERVGYPFIEAEDNETGKNYLLYSVIEGSKLGIHLAEVTEKEGLNLEDVTDVSLLKSFLEEIEITDLLDKPIYASITVDGKEKEAEILAVFEMDGKEIAFYGIEDAGVYALYASFLLEENGKYILKDLEDQQQFLQYFVEKYTNI